MITVADRIRDLSQQHPCLARLVANDAAVQANSFLSDVRSRFMQSGSLSERQISAVEQSLARADERSARQARFDEERKSRAESGIKAPSGRVTFLGEVLSVKERDGQFGVQTKATIKTELGWLCWVTLPPGVNRNCKGQAIRMTATVTPSSTDPSFGFGSRPHGIEFLSQ